MIGTSPRVMLSPAASPSAYVQGNRVTRVTFAPSPMNTTADVTPYSRVYGVDPDLFEFDKYGKMQPAEGIGNLSAFTPSQKAMTVLVIQGSPSASPSASVGASASPPSSCNASPTAVNRFMSATTAAAPAASASFMVPAVTTVSSTQPASLHRQVVPTAASQSMSATAAVAAAPASFTVPAGTTAPPTAASQLAAVPAVTTVVPVLTAPAPRRPAPATVVQAGQAFFVQHPTVLPQQFRAGVQVVTSTPQVSGSYPSAWQQPVVVPRQVLR